MVIPQDIISIIKKSEMKHVEYKKSFNKSEIKDAMLGFTNADGGKILVGVEEIFCRDGYQEGNIKGLQNRNIDQDKKVIYDLSLDFIPSIQYNFNEYCSDDYEMIYVIEVKKSKEKPVCTKGGRYKIRGEKGNSSIFPDMMRSMIFNEKERLIMLKNELQSNQKEIYHQISLIQNNINSGYNEPLTRYKTFSLISFMGTPSHFLNENYEKMEGLYHGFTILNSLLDNFAHMAMMSSTTYKNGIAQYIRHGNDVISQIEGIINLIQKRIDNLSI